MTNTLKFKSAMVEKGLTLKKLSSIIGLSTTSLSYKINNKREFTSSEIKALQKAMNLSQEERENIFFAPDVD